MKFYAINREHYFAIEGEEFTHWEALRGHPLREKYALFRIRQLDRH